MTEAVMQDAREAFHAGDYKKTLDLARSYRKRFPYDGPAMRLEALALLSCGKKEQAITHLHKILEHHPEDHISLTNLAAACFTSGRDDQAIKWLNRSIEVQLRKFGEINNVTRYNRGLIRLKNGDLENGWLDYDYRFVVGESKILGPGTTMWDGGWLGPDKTLTIWGEQGAGDYVQMARYFKTAKERSGARTILAAPKNLHRLFDGLADEITCRVEQGTHIPIFTLPRVLGVTLENLSGEPYLSVGTERAEAGSVPVVGLCWLGNQATPELRDRSMHPRYLRPVHDLQPAIECTSLQYGEGDFHPRDFYETACKVAQCDLVVTIDTSITHIAGALGVPCFVMLRYQGDFRWLRDRSDSPWYDSLRLFRQKKMGEWAPVVEEVAGAIKERFA